MSGAPDSLPLRERGEGRGEGPPEWIDLGSLLLLFVGLLALTWMRWPDALVDFWRNLYIPWRLSEGALLYTEVVDWYGPLPSLVNAAAFTVFGPGLDVLVAVNVLVALGCLFTLHAALVHVGDRGSAWVGSVVFVLVFCFGQYTMLGNYNFMTPYVSQATWGFLGVLLTLEGALARESPRGLLTAGAGLAIAWLSKAETLLAAAVVLVALVSLSLRASTPLGVNGSGPVRSPRAKSRGLTRFITGFAGVAVPVWLLLTVKGGLSYGVRSFNQVLAFTLSPDVRATLQAVPIFKTDLGTDAPLQNLLSHAGAGAVLLGVLALVGLAPRGWRRAPGLTVGLGAVSAVAVVWLTDWLRVGRALLVPVVLTAALSTLASVRGVKKWVPLSLLSLAALAMLVRMALNVRIFHYGFTMAVLATMVVVHLLVFEAPRFLGDAAPSPLGVRLGAAALVLAGSARLTAHSLEMHGAKRVTVGHGRDAITAFAPEQQRHPGLVNELVAAVEQHAPGAKTLLVFPDSAAVSYLTRRPSPIAEFEFNPVSLGFSGIPHVLAALEAHPPDVVLLCSYDLRSHGTPFFGATDESGRELAVWVKRRYVKVASGPAGPFSVTGHTWDLLALRREEPAP